MNIKQQFKIEGILKEADQLMINKNTKYENIIAQLKKQFEEEKNRRQFAEAELSLIKGIGQNSPEQKALQKELQEVKDDNRKLSLQISDMINKLRDAQF
tara:strand:+ start:559 stop:855 length:297 start_codon:yes stop_codon:yes gene_type:complete